MRLLINADDFGWDDETVDATIECFERGGLTSATIMASMPAAERACAYARAHPEFSFGVHLTFVGDGIERSLSQPGAIPDLADDRGVFLASQKTRLRALARRIDEAEIEREAIAQLDKVRGLGVPISHVDSHGHMHKFRPFRRTIARILPRYGIVRVRSVQDVYFRRPIKSPNYWLGPHWKREIARLFRTTEHLYLPRSACEADWVRQLAALRLDGTLEVGLHPGRAEDWREEERVGAVALGAAARDAKIALVTWNDV
ncbi:MAG: ChbG/HpnK family deacetylase [Phycisphaerales bacterium]